MSGLGFYAGLLFVLSLRITVEPWLSPSAKACSFCNSIQLKVAANVRHLGRTAIGEKAKDA